MARMLHSLQPKTYPRQFFLSTDRVSSPGEACAEWVLRLYSKDSPIYEWLRKQDVVWPPRRR